MSGLAARHYALTPEGTVMAHRTPNDHRLFSRHRQVFGYQDKNGGPILIYTRTTGIPRWLDCLHGDIEPVPPERLLKAWESETNVALSDWPGREEVVGHYGFIPMSDWDSYVCGGNCIPGTRQFTERFFPSGQVKLHQLASSPDLQWKEDKDRAMAWAYSCWKRIGI